MANKTGFVASKRRKRLYPIGANHPRWQKIKREKPCQHCGKIFVWDGKRAASVFRQQKFCSKKCSDLGGFRRYGKDHPNYRETARRRNRTGPYRKWVSAVFSRDQGKCQKCGSLEGLHAHHIKSWEECPELRFEVSNGITLCFRCHWEVHAALKAKAVNSVNTQAGNTEPSLNGNVFEGVTTRGRAYRRWVGKCDWCDTIISKAWSDVKDKAALFCSGSCRSKWIRAKHGPIPRQ